MKWVVDASVAAKWLAPEPDSALAETLLGEELVAPDLLVTADGRLHARCRAADAQAWAQRVRLLESG